MAKEMTPTSDAAVVDSTPTIPELRPLNPNITNVLPPASGVAPTAPPTPRGVMPGQQIPKQSFGEGMRSAVPNYTTDENGQITSNQPVRMPSVKGILGGVLMGALAGAARGAAAQTPENARGRGAAFSAGASAAERGAHEADQRARAIVQQNFENKQKAVENKTRQSLMNAQAIKLMAETDHEAALFPEHMKKAGLENQELQQKNDLASMQMDAIKKSQQESAADFLSFLTSQNIPVETITHRNASSAGTGVADTSKNVYSQLAPHASAIASGQIALMHTGQTGADNGVALLHPEDLKTMPLTTDYRYKKYDGTLNKDGSPHSVDAILAAKDATGKATGATAYDAYIAAKGSQMQLTQQQAKIAAQLQNQHVAAQTQQAKAAASKDVAEAEKARIETEQLKQFLPTPGTPGATASGEEYLNSLPESIRNTLKAVAEGREVRSPRQFLDKNGNETPFTQALHRAYPDFDVQKATKYGDVLKEFTQGKVSVSLQSGATAIDHLAELRALNTNKSRLYGTEDYNKYNNKLDTLAGELTKFYGMPETNEVIGAFKKTLGATFNRDVAIAEQAKSMKDKIREYHQTWANGQPRSSYTPPMPGISKEAQANLDGLTGDKSQGGQIQLPAGATKIVPGPDGRNHYTNDAGTVDLGVAP